MLTLLLVAYLAIIALKAIVYLLGLNFYLMLTITIYA